MSAPAGCQTTDIAIIGAGIVGLTIAWELRQRYATARIDVFEKEPELARHSSGRNSGVLHAGLYYPEQTLKARVCVEGARLLAAYCEERGLPMNRVGKVVLPVRAEDDALLDLLCSRGQNNGANVSLIDADALRALEPEAHTVTGRALHSPDTAVFNPGAIIRQLADDCAAQGVRIHLAAPARELQPGRGEFYAGNARWSYGHFINAAGLHADTLAHAFNVGRQYRILPFKGLYYNLSPHCPLNIRGHIYPVPDLRVPFLGVHFTKGYSGNIYLGPTAIPAFGREHYGALRGLDPWETPVIGARLLEQYALNSGGFRTFAHQEALRFLKPVFAQAARALVPRLRSADMVASAKVGIRAQLLNTQTRTLENDFVVQPGPRSTHVLNAISPAFTASFAFARWVVEAQIAPQLESASPPLLLSQR
ncbi:MAG: L-2-hydroxyglutarate oxidase [Vampirovibrionales bacterium]|nr:L-2-hydroxyglutarate oxidase [Vampirovibrionales bacterium]